MKKIVLIGAESTGKTTIAKQLAKYYNTIFLPEYAREYIENLKRNYCYEDLIKISKKQIELENKYIKKANNYFFIDTDLIITKIWFLEVFKKIPYILEKKILENKADLYLVMATDLKWKFDKTRENGSEERRNYLQNLYEKELINYNFNYEIVKGKNEKRFENALLKIEKFFSK